MKLACLALCALLCGACAKKPKPPKRTEPWLATPSSSVTPAEQKAHYKLTADSHVDFELSLRGADTRGTISAVEGEITLDLGALEQTRASLRADLLSLRVLADAGSDAPNTARALDALELGTSSPLDQRELLRFARFELQGLGDVQAQRLRRPRHADAGSRAIEHVRATANGSLLLHGLRVERSIAVEAELRFEGAEAAAPATIVIRTRMPFVVSLETHDVRPRDANGVALLPKPADKTPHAPREARVRFELFGTKLP